jgi:hypothetical protein
MAARTRTIAAVAVAGIAVLSAVAVLLVAQGGAPVGPAPQPAAPAPEAQPAPAAPPAPVSAPAAPPPAEQAAPTAAPPPASEAELMAQLRDAVDADPARAVELAEDGERRFPDARVADERRFLKLRALVHLGDIPRARVEAEEFFEAHPDSPLGRDVYRLTGVRPRPTPGTLTR